MNRAGALGVSHWHAVTYERDDMHMIERYNYHLDYETTWKIWTSQLSVEWRTPDLHLNDQSPRIDRLR